jgi:tRNA pseudouridine(55) synthase
MTQKQPAYVVVNKKRGETPLEALTAWKLQNTTYAQVPATYAGRLDPMAEGRLLILLGDECKRQDRYRNLDKEYEVEVVFDISTDTGDALGVPFFTGADSYINKKMIVAAARPLLGRHIVPYPSYSSKTVNGVPLFAHSLANTLNDITIPSHEETVYSVRLIHTVKVSNMSVDAEIETVLSIVPRSDEESKVLGADFRQDEIRDAWKTLFAEMPGRYFTITTLRITCASGTYMRTFANRLAKELGTTGFALSIKRNKIGRYKKLGPVGTWTKQYR